MQATLKSFRRWLQQEQKGLTESEVVKLLEDAAYKDRPDFITLLMEFNPVLKVTRPESSALESMHSSMGTPISLLS